MNNLKTQSYENTATSKKSIGFIVEGNSDADFIKYLVEQYFKSVFDAVLIPVSGKASMISSARIIVSSLITSGVEHVFILFDTDNEYSERYTQYIMETLEKVEMSEKASIITIHPFLETWILSGYMEDASEIQSMDMKTQLQLLKSYGFGKKSFELLGKRLDFEKIKKSNLNFSEFIKEIEDRLQSY